MRVCLMGLRRIRHICDSASFQLCSISCFTSAWISVIFIHQETTRLTKVITVLTTSLLSPLTSRQLSTADICTKCRHGNASSEMLFVLRTLSTTVDNSVHTLVNSLHSCTTTSRRVQHLDFGNKCRFSKNTVNANSNERQH